MGFWEYYFLLCYSCEVLQENGITDAYLTGGREEKEKFIV